MPIEGSKIPDREFVDQLIKRIENSETITRTILLREARSQLNTIKDETEKARLEEVLAKYR